MGMPNLQEALSAVVVLVILSCVVEAVTDVILEAAPLEWFRTFLRDRVKMVAPQGEVCGYCLSFWVTILVLGMAVSGGIPRFILAVFLVHRWAFVVSEWSDRWFSRLGVNRA